MCIDMTINQQVHGYQKDLLFRVVFMALLEHESYTTVIQFFGGVYSAIIILG